MEEYKIENSALVVIDLQNDITKNHKEIIAYANKLSARPERRRADRIQKAITGGIGRCKR